MTTLDALLERLGALPEEERAEAVNIAVEQTKDLIWIPNPGPQTEAYFCPADVLLYGGQGGGGKSELLLGLGLTAHRNSLIMRRTYPNLAGLTRRIAEIGGRKGLKASPPPTFTTSDGRLIEFGAAQHLGDEENWQGQPHDLLGFDEATQFLEAQVRFLMGWVRSADASQRKRTVMATNPPLGPEGEWIIGMFRPWLDITHKNPAKHGELRWFITDKDGRDEEVDGPTPIERGDKTFIPTSRTFIPAALKDNPFLVNTGYQAQLDALPEPVRSAVRDGNFMAARADADFQVIPTRWVLEAQARWTEDGWRRSPMTAMGLDPAGGGKDSAELAARHGGWFAPMVSDQGPDTANGSVTVSTIIKHRKNGCPVVIDVGGGYAGATITRMEDNALPYQKFDGSGAVTETTRDGTLKFVNARAWALWRLREDLDPEQEGGSPIALPPDPEIVADLTAPQFMVKARGIQIESKEELRKRLGRSTGKGDAIMMALAPGDQAAARQLRRKSGGQIRVERSYNVKRW